MARIFQLDPVAGPVIDPAALLPVDYAGLPTGLKATQSQVAHGLLSQALNAAVSFPAGSLGAMLVSGAGGASGSIDSFASTPGPLVETGLTITNPVLTWGLTGVSVVSQALAGPLTSGVALLAADRGKTLSGAVTADATWTLTVAGAGGNLTRQASLLFGHRVHYGRGTTATPTAAAILALPDRLATGAAGDYNLPANPGSQGYWWFAYPDSWGAYRMTDAATGLPVATFDAGVVSVTNASGHTRNFRCIRSLNALNAAMTLRVG